MMCVKPMNDLNQQVSKGRGHRWVKGQSGNPAGRAVGARQKISERLLADLASVWETHGESVLSRLAISEPGKLAQIAYGLLPRDVFISVQQQTPGNLPADEWALLVDLVQLIKASAPDGATALPSDIVPAIEETVSRSLRPADRAEMSLQTSTNPVTFLSSDVERYVRGNEMVQNG